MRGALKKRLPDDRGQSRLVMSLPLPQSDDDAVGPIWCPEVDFTECSIAEYGYGWRSAEWSSWALTLREERPTISSSELIMTASLKYRRGGGGRCQRDRCEVVTDHPSSGDKLLTDRKSGCESRSNASIFRALKNLALALASIMFYVLLALRC